MWPFSEHFVAVSKTVSEMPFVHKAVSAAVALAVVVLALGGSVYEAQAALHTSALVSVVIAALRGEP
jgi:urease accessory protein UreF